MVDQTALTDLLKESNKRNEENRILREAAKIILRRSGSNPGKVIIRMPRLFEVELQAQFFERK